MGTIHVYYYYKRYSTSPANTFQVITEAHCHYRVVDSFTLTRVTDNSYDPNSASCTGLQGGLFIGDYLDSNSMRRTNIGVWTGFRNSATSGNGYIYWFQSRRSQLNTRRLRFGMEQYIAAHFPCIIVIFNR